MRKVALVLGVVLAAGCRSGGGAHPIAETQKTRTPLDCRSLVASLGRVGEPTAMSVQLRELARLARLTRELRLRFAVDARAAADELGASIRAEHESISARNDGRVTASRRLHASAHTRYRRGSVSARAASSSCPAA